MCFILTSPYGVKFSLGVLNLDLDFVSVIVEKVNSHAQVILNKLSNNWIEYQFLNLHN